MVEKAVMVYYSILSDLLSKLSCIKDSRKSGMIKHKMTSTLMRHSQFDLWLGLNG